MNAIKSHRAFIALFTLLLISTAEAKKCGSFEWATDFDGAEKAAMIVEVAINGQLRPMQLDTGSDVSGLFHDAAEPPSGTLATSIGELTLATIPFRKLLSPAGRVQGRLGLDAFKGQIIQINYPAQKVCAISADHYQNIWHQLDLASAQIRSNKLFVHAELDGDYQSGLFFDTGASLYSLLVDRPVWQQLTGRDGNEAHNRFIQGWAHNELITTVGAPMIREFKLGSYQVANPEVHYTRERPNYFKNYPIDAKGLIGNAPFFDEVVYLDLRSDDAWFGVLRREE